MNLNVLIMLLIPNITANVVVLSITFALMNIKVPFRKTILCGFFSTLLYAIPIAITSIIMQAYPLTSRLWIYRLFVSLNPLSGLVLYFIIKKVFRFSSTRSSVVMSNHLLIDYLFCFVYLLFRDSCALILDETVQPDGFFYLDHICVVAILMLRFAVFFIVQARLNKTRNYIKIPPNYVDKNTAFEVFKTFLAVCIIYTTFVLMRIFLFPDATTPLSFTAAFVYVLLIINVILYLSYTTSKLRHRLLDWEMQATGTYISSLLHTNQEFQAIKHDFYNLLQGYGGYLSIKNYKGLEEYHKKLFTTTKQVGDFLSIIEVLQPRIAMYNLLGSVVEKANKANVSFSVNQVCDPTNIVLKDADLCKVLGILLENALEEAQLSKEKQINISFHQEDEKGIILAISNTTQGDIHTEKIFKDGYTTKPDHLGMGLGCVLAILDTYENCSLHINYHDNQFVAFLILNTEKL